MEWGMNTDNSLKIRLEKGEVVTIKIITVKQRSIYDEKENCKKY